jgi:NADH dehydrogenase
MNPRSNQIVLVTGAGGFIGKVVVRELLLDGWRVRALVRRRLPSDFPRHGMLETVLGDMRSSTALKSALQGTVAVVHLAATKADEPDSDDVNIGGARRLVAACQATDCRRIINISTQSAKIARQGVYARTKAEADRIFHAAGLAITTLRPSIVYGEEKSGVFATLLKFIQKLPVVPVLGDGQWISAPIHVRDVAAAAVACLRHDATIGQVYDLGGPDQIRFDDLIDRIGVAIGRRRPKLHIPFGLALLAARITSKLLPHSPITVSNVLGSNQNTDINIEPARRDFGFAPVDLATGLSRVFPKSGNSELHQEGRQLARYLLGVEPAPEILSRYVSGSRELWADAPDEPEVRWWRRHPRMLPVLDAAAGLLRPQSLLRQKVLLMAAILEATPEHAEFFLCRPPRKPWVFVVLAAQGAKAVAKAFVGLPVLWWARRIG